VVDDFFPFLEVEGEYTIAGKPLLLVLYAL